MNTQNSLLRDEDGASAVLFGLALPPLMAFTAFAVDLGSLYLAERELQNISDAAAAAAVSAGPEFSKATVVAQVIADADVADVSIVEIADGEYLRDASINWRERLDTSSLHPNATRVHLVRDVPLFFGSFVSAGPTSRVTAQATAARTDMAGFMLGTRVAELPGGLTNNLLSALAGTALELTPAEVDLLGDTNIDVLDLAEALGPLQEMEGETFGEIFNTDAPLHVVVQALANSTRNAQLAAILNEIARRVGSDPVLLSQLIDLGPLANSDVNDGVSGVQVDAYSLLRSILQAAHGDSYDAELDTDIAGLAGVNIRMAGGYSDERSPWLTVDTMGEVTLRTAETRLLVKAKTNSIAGLPSALEVPIYTELASAEAQMTDIVCSGGEGGSGVYVEARPSLGTLAIADVNGDVFADFTTSLWLEPATIINTMVLQVKAYADISIGGDAPQEMFFTPEDVAARRAKSVGTTDILNGTATSLAEDVELDVRALGLGIGAGGTASLVGDTLGNVTPALDELLNSLTSLLGVKLGVADVTVDRLRCGRPTIVA
ncbi:pilus assembly protein TadG-related protein [Aurantiacibacter rhizosphaerae]|uniref:Putative Flp pilus-assembly TadG-like N-terminal domain-containing protein n=1 Tax=Aurantiacibacter rhizosphaerae TaxID=2691582 RepID=A0A844XF17_9SPHN|nr:pilus assembly protein TadG-related protein [Aurantiacibacter rhizosphaerae]MWV28430.1 hypothetical protein [Aurantiacibacter rhizosphaerae]